MLEQIFIPFIAVGLAELGDKTQLAVICLASKTRQYWKLLLGVFLAFLLADGLAVIFGNIITNFVPESYIKLGAAMIFIIFGTVLLLQKPEKEQKCDIGNPFLSSFAVVFISELGDKTQIASAIFGAQYNPWLALFGIMLALTTLSFIAVYVGRYLTTKLNQKSISAIAGVVFIAIGIYTLF